MIRFDNVHKAFGEKVVLDGLTLDIPEGETTALIGFSGSGKSVLLKHVVGLLTPDAGSVSVDDEVVHDLDWDDLTALRSKVGYVFQFAALFDSMTIGDNIRLGLARRGLEPGEIEERVVQSLKVVDLEGSEDHYPAELSGGMRKRVGVARAIALRPRYILYDEPTTGLDPVTSAVIDQLMIRVREQYGTTAIVVTHDMRSAYTVGDRVAMLYEGRIRQVGTVEEIQQTEDPVVRQFIEGRPDLQGARDATALSAGGPVKQRNAFAVGGTVLVAILITVAAAIWLGHIQLGSRPEKVTVRLRTVGGMGVGAPVTLRGVKIGQVFSVELADNDWVVATLKLEQRSEIPASPAVVASTASLFGEWEAKIISLDDPLDDPTMLAEFMAAKQAGPEDWPGATLPDIGSLTAQAGRIAGDIALLTDRVGAVFDSTTAAKVRNSLDDFLTMVNRLTAFTDQQTEKVDRISTSAVAGTRDFAGAAKDLHATLSRLDSATSEGQLQAIVNSAQGSSADLRVATADLRSLLGAAREHEVSLVRILVAADSIMARLQMGQGTLGMLTTDSTLYNETTATMIELRKLIADIQVNPRKYFKFSVF